MTNCPPLDLDVNEAESKAEFHVKKQHLPRLVEMLQLPQTFKRMRRRGVLLHVPKKSVFFLADTAI